MFLLIVIKICDTKIFYLYKLLINVSCFFILFRVFRKPSNKPVKLKKHKMIARAFEKRKDINNGRMSISFHSTHDDPLGTGVLTIILSCLMTHSTHFIYGCMASDVW